MRKTLFTQLTSLLSKLRPSASTKPEEKATSNITDELVAPAEADAWLFGDTEAMSAYTDELASEMDTLADGLSGLRETLALISGEAPFPVEATTEMPCAYDYQDGDLFDGEPLVTASAQETTIGGEADFLFEDEVSAPVVLEEEARQAA